MKPCVACVNLANQPAQTGRHMNLVEFDTQSDDVHSLYRCEECGAIFTRGKSDLGSTALWQLLVRA